MLVWFSLEEEFCSEEDASLVQFRGRVSGAACCVCLLCVFVQVVLV
jgi:hypothetical protein